MFHWLLYIPTCLQLKILHSAHTVCLCVLFGPQNKEQVFPYTAIIVCYLQHIPRDSRAVHRNLYISQCSLLCKGAVPQLRQLDFRCLTQKTRVRQDVIPSGNCKGKVGNETGFSSSTSLRFSPWSRRRAANLSQRRTGFEFRSIHLGLVLPLR